MNNGHTYPHQNLTACANYNDAKVTSTPLNLASQSGILNSAQIIIAFWGILYSAKIIIAVKNLKQCTNHYRILGHLNSAQIVIAFCGI